MSCETQTTSDPPQDVFVGRQPILDRKGNTFAYELLFRGGQQNSHIDGGSDADSNQLIYNCLNVMGYEKITAGKKGFVNFTTNLLLDESYAILPAKSVVIELLETVMPTPDVIQACQKLKNAGYTLALDDFIYSTEFEPLIELADIIKIDFLLTNEIQRKPLVRLLKQRGKIMLAEKVETQEEFDRAMVEGFDYFQGYYFSKPEVIKSQQAASPISTYLKMLSVINDPAVEFEKINQVIQHDPALCYKLLKYLNSASFSLQGKITSIKHATTLLGLVQLRKWASLLCTSMISSAKPIALTNSALTKARFCELVAETQDHATEPFEYFLCGLLSSIDAMTDQPMEKALDNIQLPQNINDALIMQKGKMAQVLALATAYEKADYPQVHRITQDINLEIDAGKNFFLDAIQWTDDFLNLTL